MEQLSQRVVIPQELLQVANKLQEGYKLTYKEHPDQTVSLFKVSEHTEERVREYNHWQQTRGEHLARVLGNQESIFTFLDNFVSPSIQYLRELTAQQHFYLQTTFQIADGLKSDYQVLISQLNNFEKHVKDSVNANTNNLATLSTKINDFLEKLPGRLSLNAESQMDARGFTASWQKDITQHCEFTVCAISSLEKSRIKQEEEMIKLKLEKRQYSLRNLQDLIGADGCGANCAIRCLDCFDKNYASIDVLQDKSVKDSGRIKEAFKPNGDLLEDFL